MAGGETKENKELIPEFVILSVQQNTGKFIPRQPNYTNEECVYSPHGPNFTDMDSGVFLRKAPFPYDETWGNMVEICNCIKGGRVELVTNHTSGQIINPFPKNLNRDINKHLHVDEFNGRVFISSGKVGTRCSLTVYDREDSTDPVARAKLLFTTKEIAEKIINKQAAHERHMREFLTRKGWINQR
jgi:hypothetical protein